MINNYFFSPRSPLNRSHFLFFLLTLGLSFVLIACGSTSTNEPSINNTTEVFDSADSILPTESDLSTQEPLSTESSLNEQETNQQIDSLESDHTDLMSQITTLPSETLKYPALETTIMDYFELTTEEANANPTQYYYNYIDTNNDQVDELFALVMGPLTSDTGKSTLLHILVSGETLTIMQSIPLVENPIILSDHLTNGVKDLLITNFDLSENGYVKLTNSEGAYSNPNEGEVLTSLELISGTMLMDNDVFQDREDGAALYLAEGANPTY